jgi:hypothetical protein
MRPWSAASLALLVTLSGCSGDPAPGASPSGGQGTPADEAASDLALAPLTLPAGVPLSGTMSLEDAFPTGDTCNSNPARGCVERTHDLGTFLPEGLPLKLTVDLSWDPGDGIFHMETWIDGEGMVWLHVDNSTLQPGHWRWSALVVPGPQSTAYVISGGPQTAAAATSASPYRLDVNFTASNQTVPELVPVAVEMGPNSTVGVQSSGGDPLSFLLYGPDDDLVQQAEGELTLPADAARGDYIVMPLATAMVLVPGGGGLRFVDVAFVFADEVTVPSGGSVTATVSSDQPPFLAGAYYYGQQQTPLMAGVELAITLKDPDGTTLVAQTACQPFCAGGFNAAWGTGVGQPLKAGSYSVTVESQAAHDTYVGAYLGTFVRGT